MTGSYTWTDGMIADALGHFSRSHFRDIFGYEPDETQLLDFYRLKHPQRS